MSNMTPKKAFIFEYQSDLFLIFLIYKAVQCMNFLKMELKRNNDIFNVCWFNYPTRSFTNPIVYRIKNFLKRFVNTIFRTNSCLNSRTEINRSKFSVCILLVCLAKLSLLFEAYFINRIWTQTFRKSGLYTNIHCMS